MVKFLLSLSLHPAVVIVEVGAAPITTAGFAKAIATATPGTAVVEDSAAGTGTVDPP